MKFPGERGDCSQMERFPLLPRRVASPSTRCRSQRRYRYLRCSGVLQQFTSVKLCVLCGDGKHYCRGYVGKQRGIDTHNVEAAVRATIYYKRFYKTVQMPSATRRLDW